MKLFLCPNVASNLQRNCNKRSVVRPSGRRTVKIDILEHVSLPALFDEKQHPGENEGHSHTTTEQIYLKSVKQSRNFRLCRMMFWLVQLLRHKTVHEWLPSLPHCKHLDPWAHPVTFFKPEYFKKIQETLLLNIPERKNHPFPPMEVKRWQKFVNLINVTLMRWHRSHIKWVVPRLLPLLWKVHGRWFPRKNKFIA